MIISQKIGVNLSKNLEELSERLGQERNLSACFIFGSYAIGHVSPLSDVDIAILIDEGQAPIDLSRAYNYYYHLICQELKTNEVDLIILNEAPSSFTYNILKEGKLILLKDEDSLRIFIEKTVRNYLDTASIRQELYFHLRQRLENGVFGCD